MLRAPLGIALVSGLLSAGCGGSSSETPPPLEPLPVNLHYDRSATALPGDQPLVEADAGAQAPSAASPNEPGGTGPASPSTWGGTRGPSPMEIK